MPEAKLNGKRSWQNIAEQITKEKNSGKLVQFLVEALDDQKNAEASP